MSASIDAVSTAAEIKSTYRRYLQSLLSLREPALDAAVRKAINTTALLDKGPYLEATPPYKPGASVADLIADGTLSSGFAPLGTSALPLDRPLYVHQEEAIRKVSVGRNVVVATGTGSGKTESFLVPILDSLVRERDAGTLGPGVRALLLYPMNALANDQLKRLRQLLASYPDITFGRYTGDTEQTHEAASAKFAELNIGEPQLPNELLSRDEMQQSPPHLLLTNYAMLEYLLLRPQDMALFPEGQHTWKFIAVDEAHVYDGSKGAEIAMLLRRVRDRVAPDRPIQCIATSATVGGKGDAGAITKFATNLFGEPFEWIPDDSDRQDVITAIRSQMPRGPYWGPLTADDYIRLAGSSDIAQEITDRASSSGSPSADAYDSLLREASLVKVRETLAQGPIPFSEVAPMVFPEEEDAAAEAGLAALVDVASALHHADGSTALSARYHLFLRATEGAFTCFSPSGPHVRLARHDDCPECNAPMFEIGACTRCGAVHLVGTVTNVNGQAHLTPRKSVGGNTWLVFTEGTGLIDEDEEASADGDADVTSDDAALCTECGALSEGTSTACPGCHSEKLRMVRRLKKKGEDIAGCLVCGARGPATVRLFETGPDASGAVIASSLYQNVPPDDRAGEGHLPGEGRKLLAFSDSRQGAAYFAPYLEDSYDRLKRRRLLTQGLHGSDAGTEPVMVEDLNFAVRKEAAKVGTFQRRMSAQQQAREIGRWVMGEVVATDDRQSLEGLGLLAITLDVDPAWVVPKPLLELGLSEPESWALMQQLVRTLRQQGAVTMPDDVEANDEIFAPRLGPIFVRQVGAEAVRKVLSWLPTRGTNRRIDYLQRVLNTIGSNADPADLLTGVWSYLTASTTPVDWLRATTQKGIGVVHQVDQELLRLRLVTAGNPVYRCSVCRRISPFSIRGVCPALRCEGVLEQFAPADVRDERDHYRVLYQSMLPVPMRAQEHTAQWTSAEAARIQREFTLGVVNTLSCSTTFELGVDVGELQAVMLRNMPPTTSNYLQRAGRAGRRSGAAALVVTFANRRSHDLSRYAEPEVMMAGQVRAPYVPLENERIDRRHAHSVVLAAFFAWYLETHQRIARTAGDFFLPGVDGSSPAVDLVADYLSPVPQAVSDSLLRVLPVAVAKEIGVDTNAWVPRLLDLLDNVRAELAGDVGALEKLQTEAANARKYKLADRYHSVSVTLQKRDLLGFLGTRNVLPKYGFPVDSVELRTAYTGNQAGGNLDLTRNLSQAIYEYAPDATLVAGGLLWTARGIYRLPGRDLEEFEYHVCRTCGGFWQAIADLAAECPHCGELATTSVRKITVPEFGFVAARQPTKPGPRPPRRSWSGATYILKEPEESRTRTLSLRDGTCTASAGPRGRLVAVADGPGGKGFWVCNTCGSGVSRAQHPRKPPEHSHLISGNPCRGQSRWLDLAHSYETDLLTLVMSLPGASGQMAAWKSLLYAVLEAACNELEITRDDVGGSLQPTGAKSWSLVLFDRVPGGAGHVLLIERHLERVLKAALKRVESCECGMETSCYGCLRSYENQRDHDELSRGAAVELLSQMV